MYKRSNRSGFSGNNRRPHFNNNRKQGTRKSFSDISKFVNKSSEVEIVADIAKKQFADFAISEELKKNILQKGYESPTPIQDQAIDYVLQGRDLLGIANTGTGKTGAFLIPLIDKVLKNRMSKTLIVTPTRELALQIQREFNSLNKYLEVYAVSCIGGTSMYQQRRELSRKFNFVIGTPGRLKDLINQRMLSISDFDTVVLDEVDRMFDMGFVKDVEKILGYLSKNRQSLFFSATISNKVMELIEKNSKNLITVSVKYADTARTIDQDIIKVNRDENKIDVLHKLLIKDGFDKVLIFGKTKHGVKKLCQKLTDRGFKADSIHGNKSQSQRERALGQFRQNRIKILVATDVVARGLDISGVTHVINYDLPQTYEDYVHRIGRTGRANLKGKALTFVE